MVKPSKVRLGSVVGSYHELCVKLKTVLDSEVEPQDNYYALQKGMLFPIENSDDEGELFATCSQETPSELPEIETLNSSERSEKSEIFREEEEIISIQQSQSNPPTSFRHEEKKLTKRKYKNSESESHQTVTQQSKRVRKVSKTKQLLLQMQQWGRENSLQ